MGSLKKIVSGVAPLAGLIPGPAGMIAGTVLPSLLGGNSAQGSADRYNGMAGQVAAVDAGLHNQYYPALVKALLAQSGFDPSTGKMDPNFHLYAPRANAVGHDDAAAVNLHNTLDSAAMSMAGRGFDAPNSMSQSVVGNITRGAYRDKYATDRQADIEGQQEQYRRMLSAAGLIGGNVAAPLQVAGAYQGVANANANGLGQGLAALGASGTMGQGNPMSWLGGQLFGTKKNPWKTPAPPVAAPAGGK